MYVYACHGSPGHRQTVHITQRNPTHITNTNTNPTAVFQQKADAGGGGAGGHKRRKVAESKIKVARAAAKQVCV